MDSRQEIQSVMLSVGCTGSAVGGDDCMKYRKCMGKLCTNDEMSPAHNDLGL